MNAAHRTEADERLLDAALQQLLQPATTAARVRGLRRARFAAAALLGIAVVVGTMVLSRQPAVVPAVQNPEPRAPVIDPPPPPLVMTQNVEELDALPPETQNLWCKLSPSELAHLQRLTGLRRLVIVKDLQPTGGAGPSGPELWTDPKPELLAPLQALPELREIQWPQTMRVQAKHIAALVAAPKLESMTFVFDRVVQAPELADALANLPRLTALGFMNVPIQGDFLERLAKLPLTRLSFLSCPGLDDKALEQIATMRSLRALSLTFLNGLPAYVNGNCTMPVCKLTAAGLASIGRLPALRELSLESELSDEVLHLLPSRLEKLILGYRFVSPAVASALKPMASLRELSVGAGPDIEGAERMASLLGTLRLQRLDYCGAPSAALLQAIAQQPELETLSLQRHGGEALAPLTQAPRLRDLVLQNQKDGLRPRPMTLDVLQPLVGCKALQRLRLFDCGLGAAEVQALLAGKVQVEVLEYL